MNLDLLLLQREELPILHGTSFYVPIHPDLLKEDIRLDPEIAKGVFPQAAQEYHQDLAAYIETMQDEKEKKESQCGRYGRDAFCRKGERIFGRGGTRQRGN